MKIPKGNIVFFVGPSGIGKSTILETLGFMNNTIHSVEVFSYQGQDVRGVWAWNDEKLSDFRNREFSFIFQQNNLMPNFTAYENVVSTALIQGMPRREAAKKARQVLQQLDLPYEEDRPVYKYSGGQQQRLAFARAIMSDFSVLFGDEPTGNLDPYTANKLADTLVELIRQKESTAIIVSHDIPLATRHADIIVRIMSEEEHTGAKKDQECGHIVPRSIFTREGDMWVCEGKSYTTKELTIILPPKSDEK